MNKHIMNDQKLYEAALKLDEDALSAIFDQFSPALYKYALRLCHDPTVAENIVGDAFAQLLEEVAAGKVPAKSLRTYLYKIAHQLLLDHSRANPQKVFVELTLFHENDKPSETASSWTQERAAMEALISVLNTELNYEQRQVIILRFLDDFSLKETAEIIGKEINSTKVIQNRGIAKLRRAMAFHNDWAYSSTKSNDAHSASSLKSTIDALSARLPSAMKYVSSLLTSAKRETIEEYKPKEAKLHVTNLPYSIDADIVMNIFSHAGTVKSTEVFKDSAKGHSKSSAYVVMSTLEEAIRAMYMFHRKKFDGRSLAVKIGEKEEEDNIDEELSVGPAEFNKRSLRVFLCHAHKDAVAVQSIYKHLTNNNIETWLDKEKLLPGSDWEHEIREAVRTSDIVVVCLSKGFDQKGFRQKEVRIALEESALQPEGEIFIMPARLEECEVLPSLRHLHWVNLFESDGYEKLIRTFKVRAQKIGAVL
jgi:RNA polymerase sigma factor (sigma-70 family)